MHFSEWRRIQRDREMFNISSELIAEGLDHKNFQNIVHTFLSFAKKEIGIKQVPKITFVDNPKFAKKIAAFGQIENNKIVVQVQNRQIMDILRTVAHELVHYHQHQRGSYGSGIAGSSNENQANQIAGTIVRKFGERHSNLFALSPMMNEMKMKKKRKKMVDIDSDHYPMELT